MVELKNIGGNIEVLGTFDFGYMGNYTGEKISFADIEELREWDCIMKKIDVSKSTDEEVIKCLEEYINQFERKIQDNIKQVNDNFLLNVYVDMEKCGMEFWENDELTVKEFLPEEPEENVYRPHWEEMGKINDEYYDTPNDGSVTKTDVEAVLRAKFPMFNWDRLISSIVPEYIGIEDGYISFQCSDAFNCSVLCGAYDDLDEKLTFTDWHNF